MKLLKLSIIMGYLIFGYSAQAIEVKKPSFIPPDGKVLLFIGQDQKSINAYIDSTGHRPVGFMLYTSIQDMSGLLEPVDHGAGIHHAQYWAKKYPGCAFQIGLYMVDALDGVLRGEYDENIEKLGKWLKKTDGLIYLRIGYEFDLPDNHYDPKLYKEAFRYIVDHLRAEGVSNVAYVWHSYGYLNPEKPMMDWYPGDEYVDFFGVSFFKAFNAGNMNFILNRAKEHQKYFMIAEATPFGTGALQGEKSWNLWFKPFFKFINDNNIQVVSYINTDWEEHAMFRSKGWGNSSIQQNEVVKKRWLEEVKGNKYLQLAPANR